jgi:glucosyl-3-phosphoglycerate phosphatase
VQTARIARAFWLGLGTADADNSAARGMAIDAALDGPQTDIAIDARLREVDVGGWQGLSTPELEVQYPDEHAAWKRGEDIRRGGGESYADVARRMRPALDERLRESPRGTLLALSHGGAIRAVVAEYMRMPLQAFAGFKNTAVAVIEFAHGEGPRLVTYNNVLANPASVLTT